MSIYRGFLISIDSVDFINNKYVVKACRNFQPIFQDPQSFPFCNIGEGDSLDEAKENAVNNLFAMFEDYGRVKEAK